MSSNSVIRGFVIAVDGLTAAGKGTLSKALARHFGFDHLDTGLLYRATAKKVLDLDLSPLEAAQQLTASDLADEASLRNEVVAQKASEVAAVPEVRTALIQFQRDFAASPKGAILDGRDIGTVICPDAHAKLFVTASSEVRAERRYKELLTKGQKAIKSRVLADLIARDARDQQREDAPAKAADEALVLDTSDMDAEQALAKALEFIVPKLD
ncbi:MAG: (d)CMP kinase [Alphaproteobacteria bacterium]